MIAGKDNSLLVEFEFLMDLDLAIYKYIRYNYGDSDYVDKEFISLNDEKEIVYRLLSRKHINPLEIIIPNEDTTNIYYELMGDKYIEILKEATVYDTFGLMITFLNEASSVSIDVLCKSDLESKIINGFNKNLNTVIFKDKSEVSLYPYTALYLKYFVNIVQYQQPIRGKHIYIPAAKYNMEDDKDCVDINLLKAYSGTNEIHLIDLYKDIKFRFNRRKEEQENADLL